MNYYENIKDHLIRNEINHRIKDYSKNKSDLETYYEVGKLLVIAQGGEKRAKYGDKLIKEYSKKLTMEIGKGYTTTSLKRMRQFYLIIEKGAPLAHQLTWSHYQEILSLKNIDEIRYYLSLSITNCLSKRKLRERIKNNEYKYLADSVKEKYKETNKLELIETIKNPIIISNPNSIDVYKENILMKLILDDLDSFLEELGVGYYYVGSEYKLELDNKIYRIDLLLYNIEYECYVVVELKIGELKKEYISQVKFYMNYIDKNKKKLNQNETIGIILCHKNNELIMEYCSDPRIISREYVLN